MPSIQKLGFRRKQMGRHTIRTPELEQLLIVSLQNGLSMTQACLQANVSRETVRLWCKEDEDLLAKLDLAEQFGSMKARQNIMKAINDGDKSMSTWYLERRDKSFKPKSDITTGDEPIPTLVTFAGSDDDDNKSSERKNTDTV